MVKKMLVSLLMMSMLALLACAGNQGSAGSASIASAATSAQANQASMSQSPSASEASTATTSTNAASSETTSASASEASASAASASEATAASSVAITVNGASLTMELADTQAASSLVELLRNGPISVSLRPYGGFEKVGPLPQALPSADEQVTTEPGDVMLYQGNQITIFHGSNTWAYTPLGHIPGATEESLLAAFGEGDATIELSLA